MSQINNNAAATAIKTTAPKPKPEEKKEEKAVEKKKTPSNLATNDIGNKNISEA